MRMGCSFGGLSFYLSIYTSATALAVALAEADADAVALQSAGRKFRDRGSFSFNSLLFLSTTTEDTFCSVVFVASIVFGVFFLLFAHSQARRWQQMWTPPPLQTLVRWSWRRTLPPRCRGRWCRRRTLGSPTGRQHCGSWSSRWSSSCNESCTEGLEYRWRQRTPILVFFLSFFVEKTAQQQRPSWGSREEKGLPHLARQTWWSCRLAAQPWTAKRQVRRARKYDRGILKRRRD